MVKRFQREALARPGLVFRSLASCSVTSDPASIPKSCILHDLPRTGQYPFAAGIPASRPVPHTEGLPSQFQKWLNRTRRAKEAYIQYVVLRESSEITPFLEFGRKNGAQDWTRTSMLLALAPETSASTNSATWALKRKNKVIRVIKKWWVGTESNRRHTPFQGVALPTELPTRADS